jgi:small subunit ribosomal protein S8e
MILLLKSLDLMFNFSCRKVYKLTKLILTMAIWKLRSKRKATGGRYHTSHKKKARHIGKDPVYTKVSSKIKRKILSVRGGNTKVSLQGSNVVNLMINGKAKSTKISRVVENASSRHFVRQNVISKGAVIETPEGLAKVTSRPTQDGIVNAVLIKKN